MEINHSAKIVQQSTDIPVDIAIEIIDKLLSKGWTSILDISIALDHYARENGYEGYQKGTEYAQNSDEYFYELMKLVPEDKNSEGKFQERIRNNYFYHMSEIYTLIHLEEADKQKKDLFIKSIDKLNREDSSQYDLSEATKSYLSRGRGVKVISIYRYIENGYSIKKDMETYNSAKDKQKDYNQKGQKLKNKKNTVDASEIREDFNKSLLKTFAVYNDSPDLEPEVISIKTQEHYYKKRWEKLLCEVDARIKKKIFEIEHLKQTKPEGWREKIAAIYYDVFNLGRDIIDDADTGLYALQYGKHLSDAKEFSQAQNFLDDALSVLNRSLRSGNSEAQEKYALILQNLAYINTSLRNFDIAENEAKESLGIFKELSKVNGVYEYGIAALLCSLAEIHMEQRLFETVEKEYKEAISIFSKLYESEPAKYSYYLMECFCSIGHYYMLVSKMDESVSAFEEAIHLFENLSEDNYAKLSPHKAKVLVNYSSTLTSIGDFERSEQLLQEAICILRKLNGNSIKEYDEELANAYHNLGILFLSRGALRKSLDNLNIAEELRRTLASANPLVYNFYLAATLNYQATAISRMPDHNEEDIKKWQEAISLLKIYENCPTAEYLIKAGNYNLALAVRYYNTDKVELAHSCLLDAEKSFREVFDKNSSPKMFEDAFAMTLALLGDMYSQKCDADFPLAELKYKEAIEIGNWYCYSSEEVDISPLVYAYAEYGIALHGIGRYKESIAVLTSAIELFEQKKDRVVNFDFINSRIIFAIALRDDCGYRMNDSTQESGVCSTDVIPPSEALSKVISLFNEILNLDKNDFDYRNKCHALYSIIVEYENLLDKTPELADILSSYCKFLSEEYGFFEMIKYAPHALKIYADLIAQNDRNFEIKRKFVELLHIYCGGLVEVGLSKELNHIIEYSEKILGHDVDEANSNDVKKTYLALKQEFSIDFLVSSSKDSFEKSHQLLEGYRLVSSPEIPLMLRFLFKTALYACDYNKWEIAERYINEAETLMNGREISCLEERSILGEIYALKGKYLLSTQLKDSKNYAQYSYDKSLSAYYKAKEILIAGIQLSPIMFKSQLLDIDRAILRCLSKIQTVAVFEIRDIIIEILRLNEDLLAANPMLFIWRSIDAHLEVEEVWQDLYFANSKNIDELTNLYNNSLASYDDMISRVSFYLASWPEYYSKYSAAITDAKKRLGANYKTKMAQLNADESR